MGDSSPIFDLPRLLICEGPEDIAFFHKLIEAHGLPTFHVRSTGLNRHEAGGNSKFGERLKAIRTNRGFQKLQHIVLVSDNDNDHDSSFQNICDQVDAASFQRPHRELERTATVPSIMIMMLPLGKEKGALENVCAEVAKRADGTAAAHVDKLIDDMHGRKWSVSRRGKAWLRCNLAVRCAHDPFVLLGAAFRERRTQNLIPIGDTQFFAPIARILATYA